MFYIYNGIFYEIFLCFSLFPFFALCFALRQNAFTIPWDFLFYILCILGKFKRYYEYNLSLIYKSQFESLFQKNWGWFLRKELRINQEYFRVILVEFLRIGRLRSDLNNSYIKKSVQQMTINVNSGTFYLAISVYNLP